MLSAVCLVFTILWVRTREELLTSRRDLEVRAHPNDRLTATEETLVDLSVQVERVGQVDQFAARLLANEAQLQMRPSRNPAYMLRALIAANGNGQAAECGRNVFRCCADLIRDSTINDARHSCSTVCVEACRERRVAPTSHRDQDV